MDRDLDRIVQSTRALSSSLHDADNNMNRERGPTDRGPTDRGPTDRGPTDRGPTNYLSKGTLYLNKISEKLEKLDKVPSFYKIMFLIFFYIFFYKIFYDIGIFFGLNNLELIIYMTWFGMILFFASFISAKRSRLK